MHFKQILFPTDLTQRDGKALQLATSLARKSDASLLIIHVLEAPISYGAGHRIYARQAHSLDTLDDLLHRIVPTDKTVAHEHQMLRGDPARQIVSFAEYEQVELIVIGTHSRSSLVRTDIGSVAQWVVRHATCPVLIYGNPNCSNWK